MRDSDWITIAKLFLCRTLPGDLLGRIPFVKRAYANYTYRRTDHGALFVGVFPSYEAALREIPSQNNKGWDNEQSSRIWITHCDYLQPTTYTVYFWLNHLLSKGYRNILDHGGSIGLSYYAYSKRIALDAVDWTVAEVKHLVNQGRKLAQDKHVSHQLHFVESEGSLPHCEILYSCGALQFDPNGVPGILERISGKPAHLLLNKLPLTDENSYWTNHNFGPAVAPYKVYNRREFLEYFTRHDYIVVDTWEVFDMSVDIPFHSRKCVPRFSGFYMIHKDAQPDPNGSAPTDVP